MTTNDSLPMAEVDSTTDSGIPKTSMEDNVPLDKARLTMLLVNGKRFTFDFDPSTSVETVKTYVLDHWPQDWAEQKPSTIKSIEFVYLGKFLDNDAKLKDNGLMAGNATIIHLVIRQYSKKADEDSKSLMAISGCKCCLIM
ncbi:ubiquitin-2 like Rad60 SUMO-like-domain-containing protein [Gongronella butleri]|nr:ubiquitin-2 like Rad60 SUMO-like-domain-containing protein [Gongronella butleri]